MYKRLEQRMTALEQMQNTRPQTATQLHEVFTKCNVPAPEPIQDEDGGVYMSRVPTESLEALLVAYGIMQP